MPYMKVTEDGKVRVYRKGPDGKPMGKMMGEHENTAQADEQIAALYANEDKETKEGDHTKCGGYYDEDYVFVPFGVVSFDDLAAVEQAEESAKEARKLTNYFSQIANNIMHNLEVADKAGMLAKLANDYAGRVKGAMSMRGKEKPEAKDQPAPEPKPDIPKEQPQQPAKESELFIWKEGDVYHWIAAYSNNYRDDDNPAEIISTQSHKEFDEALARGEYPMPEAWLWHVPYKVGQTHFHTFDETTGFTVAAGSFDKGMEWAAEGIIKAGWEDVSHGMPSGEIERDEKDRTIITRHRTREISFLPKGRAANKLAFSVISKEDDAMGIPAHKLPEFEKAVGPDKVKLIEEALEGGAKKAQEEKREQKEAEAPAQAEQPAAPPEQPDTLAVDNQALAQAIASAVMAAMGPVAETIKALQVEVKELQKTDAQKVAEKAANTPPASLEALTLELIGGSLFGKDTEIDGRSQLARSKPKEAPAKTAQGTGLFFESWLTGQQQ